MQAKKAISINRLERTETREAASNYTGGDVEAQMNHLKAQHSGLNGGHEQRFMVLKINKIMYISLPHTQDIMFQKNLGQIFASRVQEVALKLPYEAENINITIFSHYQNSSY